MGKVSKVITKVDKVPHPQSRKTAQLTKKIVRVEHRKKSQKIHAMRVNLAAEKYQWFQKECPDVEVCTPELLMQLITSYLQRFDDELNEIELKHGIGGKRSRQHANREDIIKMTKKNEYEEYKTCGIELPDMLDQKMFKMLKNWNGELRFLQNFKLARFSLQRLTSLSNKK